MSVVANIRSGRYLRINITEHVKDRMKKYGMITHASARIQMSKLTRLVLSMLSSIMLSMLPPLVEITIKVDASISLKIGLTLNFGSFIVVILTIAIVAIIFLLVKKQIY